MSAGLRRICLVVSCLACPVLSWPVLSVLSHPILSYPIRCCIENLLLFQTILPMTVMDSVNGVQALPCKNLKDRPGPAARMDSSQSTRTLSPHSPEDSSRSSFSSVRENDSDLVQVFTSTKVSSYSRPPEDALEDQASPSAEMSTTVTQFMPPVTQPQSRLHGCWFPAVAADGFKGWKQIDVKGRIASKSYGDLQALKMVWSPPATPPSQQRKESGRDVPGSAPIERLPLELLGECAHHVPQSNLNATNI